MATVLLQAAGAAIGGLFGGFGAIIGRAAGALAGYALDQSLFGEHRTIEGPRLADLNVQSSREGAAIARVYGRVRLSGQIIWATRFEEVVSEDSGGKGGGGSGTTTLTYRYFANFAVGLCEGKIARVGRVWADGKPFDLSSVTHRIYAGSETQSADSLIEAKQGEGNAPAYRGTAYIVFERLPLENFGNRLPQFAFEVIRPIAGIEDKIHAITVIPGSTEFGYDTEPVFRVVDPGNRYRLNHHVVGARTDWEASLDELQAICPNLESVALVVSWFGDDLRVNHCELKPGVVDRTSLDQPEGWRAAGLTRASARLISRFEGRAAFGGTPSDAGVIRAIRDLRARGLKVTFYPFIMMDIPAGNGLADPYGGDEQGAYPWRGSLTLSVEPGRSGSPDKTSAAATEIAGFVGAAAPGDFAVSGDVVAYSGPNEWSFRRLILHHAKLCQAAGGVEAFLIGSELRGLTTLRSSATHYPFVAALVDLAGDVRSVLGSDTRISYGADWTEYLGHQPADGSGDVFFHLDPLWASAAIDFIGIDNYMPLSDWRDGTGHLDEEHWDSGRSAAYFRSNIAGGERYDWYYASDADRFAQERTPIADGAYDKPWLFRAKDLVGWWSNHHHDRPGGVELSGSTGWEPKSKPIRFTELGCPSVDKGPNQPNVFPDPKSSASALPYFSTGARDDLVQRRFIDATLDYWNPDDPNFDPDNNPVSLAYGGRMVDHRAIHLWTWDARPFPIFPYRLDIWSDGKNWETGHWLSGRLGALCADALVRRILKDFGVTDFAVAELDGMVDGYLIGEVTSARRALEPLAQLLMFEALESGDVIRFVRRGRRAKITIDDADLAEDNDRPLVAIRRAQETELPSEVAIGFADTLADFRPASVNSRRLVTGSKRTEASETGVVMTYSVANGLADTLLQDLWAGRETISLNLRSLALKIEPSDICEIALASGTRTVLVTRIEDGAVRRLETRTIEPDILAPVPSAPRIMVPPPAAAASAPEIMLLDLPLLTGGEAGFAPHLAAFAEPWPGAISLALGTPESGYPVRQIVERRATIGELVSSLAAGPLGRWDRANTIEIRLFGGSLAGAPELGVLNGANAAAIGTPETGFEVLQFQSATLTGPGAWRLKGLLRGQAGTADLAAAGHAAGARFILIDAAVEPLSIAESESGLELILRCGPAGAVYDPDDFVDVPLISARRGLKCLALVHARAARDAGTGDVAIRWIRQTRIGGDAWEPVEVPLGETSESYRVAILDGATTLRVLTANAPSVVYSAAQQFSDFGLLPSEISVRISQVSPTEGPGLAMESLLNV
jgi:hypothetical protein